MPASNPAYSSPSYTATPITGDRLKALAPAAVRTLWKKGVEVFAQTSDFCKEMCGSSPLSIIQTETDTAKGAGQKIVFTNRSGLYGEAHLGDDRFHTSAHYEELLMGTNELTVDWFRHGVTYTERSEELMGMRGEIVNGLPAALGEWGGRMMTEKMMMLWRDQVPAENVMTLNDPLGWNEIVEYGQIMKRWGATAPMIGRDPAGKAVRGYAVVACTDALTSLELDDDFKAAIRATNYMPNTKYIFSGGYTPVRGHIIKEYEAFEHDGYGAIGSPMNPMGRLATAITGGINVGAANYITLGGSDYDANNILVKPAKYFPEYAYPVQAGVTLTPANQDFYVAIINPPNATTDPNKYGLYRIGNDQLVPLVANDGVKLAIEAALTSTSTAATGGTSGAVKVTAADALGSGSPAWDASVHTNEHPVDALVVLVWPTGVAKFCSFMLGAASSRRGWGKYRNERTTDGKEGNFVREVYFNSVFGQAIRLNRKQRAPGVLTLWHEGQYAGTPLPLPS
jgi:hypothetical protein